MKAWSIETRLPGQSIYLASDRFEDGPLTGSRVESGGFDSRGNQTYIGSRFLYIRSLWTEGRRLAAYKSAGRVDDAANAESMGGGSEGEVGETHVGLNWGSGTTLFSHWD